MMNLLKAVFDYRNLKVRRYTLRAALGERERERLRDLEGLFESREARRRALPDRPQRHFPRFTLGVKATIEIDDHQSMAVTVIDVSGGGMSVVPAPQLRRGDIAVVTVLDGDAGVEYRLPVQAVWRSESPFGSTLGFAFVGVPAEARPTAAEPAPPVPQLLWLRRPTERATG